MTDKQELSGAAKPVAWLYEGPDGEHYIREHRDFGHAALIRVGWKETPLVSSLSAATSRDALAIGEAFLDACYSAWACGEPPHRVKIMVARADEFRAALNSLSTEKEPTPC